MDCMPRSLQSAFVSSFLRHIRRHFDLCFEHHRLCYSPQAFVRPLGILRAFGDSKGPYFDSSVLDELQRLVRMEGEVAALARRAADALMRGA